jgi:DNA-binding winged helix-turn-helix (wHTH) protein
MPQGRIRFETFELDLQTGELHKAGSRVQLQDQPARLLAFLANRSGQLVTRDEIHRELWKDGEFVEFEHAVNTAIHKIRVALDDNTESPRIIETLPRKGYRFIASIDFLQEVAPSPGRDLAGPLPDSMPDVMEEDFVLPLSAATSRVLFLLAQIPYVVTYLVVFYHWYNLDEALTRTFGYIPVEWSRPVLQVLALIGFSVRIYLIALVGWGHSDAGPRYRRLFPFLLLLDAIWAATPLLIQHSGGLALISWASLILMGWLIFGQKTLMQRIEQGR